MYTPEVSRGIMDTSLSSESSIFYIKELAKQLLHFTKLWNI